ncbi:hypothetical protein [Paenibacillus tengchongensis]|uniref:hypothetical protein n=1 Tax=Paenibacillus tengchongensis TaxID=2608684 RepID=UPI00124DA6AA|nr:hypothetical protein [Paenibacillus tengchongensis]
MKNSKRFMVVFMAFLVLLALTATAAAANPAVMRERGVTFDRTVDNSAPAIFLFPNTTPSNLNVYAKITNVNAALIKAEYYLVNGGNTIYLGTMNPLTMSGGTAYGPQGSIFMVKVTSIAGAGVTVPFSITFY